MKKLILGGIFTMMMINLYSQDPFLVITSYEKEITLAEYKITNHEGTYILEINYESPDCCDEIVLGATYIYNFKDLKSCSTFIESTFPTSCTELRMNGKKVVVNYSMEGMWFSTRKSHNYYLLYLILNDG